MQPSIIRRISRLLTVGALAGGALWILAHAGMLKSDLIAAWLQSFGSYAPLAFIVARILGAALLAPGSVIAICAGVMFGPVWGAIYNLIASTAGAVLAFGIARFLVPDGVSRLLRRRVELARLIEGVEQEGWRFVAFVRLVPLFPYNLLNYALGLTRIPLADYTLTSLVCMIPADIAYVYLGYAGREALAGAEDRVQLGMIAVGLLATLAFVPHFVRGYARRRNEARSGDRKN